MTDSEVEEVLEALESHYMNKLSPWEYDFVLSITEQWERRQTLTDAQRKKLNEIWDGFRTGRR